MTDYSTLQLNDFREGYVDVVDHVLRYGHEVAPRGENTLEVLGVTLVLPATAPMLPTGTGRKVSTKLAAVESLQVIGGFSDTAALVRVNAGLAGFADQGTFHGAYGPRARPQMDMVMRRLQADPLTRRAVVTLWDPLRDQVEGVKNYPCTTQLQFLMRDGALNCHVTMRANDAWHGLAYDAFVFSQLQCTVAHQLSRLTGRYVPVGDYVHQASSLHLYEQHWEAARELAYPRDDAGFMPHGLGSLARARAIADGTYGRVLDPSDGWYIDKAAGERAA